MTKVIAMILAGGFGSRFCSNIPKQYTQLLSFPVLLWSIKAFCTHPKVKSIYTVLRQEDLDLYNTLIYSKKTQNFLGASNIKLKCIVLGGAHRQESVYNGLLYIKSEIGAKQEFVLIHDGVRPLISEHVISSVIDLLSDFQAVDVLLPITDTVKRLENDKLSFMQRNELYITQTPQGFHLDTLLDAHMRAKLNNQIATDDISLCIENKVKIGYVIGDKSNIKITHKSDLKYAEFLLQQNSKSITDHDKPIL
ncbi:MAG: 2-C-methyl-D-erythritol 4-phosphate cytidylyltransferase [Proteobacteria bacterium]|nr:2-C-methyl-D-erythritol 4-phosphate cytidylyltransferase [Pseudomonadota bacterium]